MPDPVKPSRRRAPPFGLRLSPEQVRELSKRAKERGCTRSELIKDLLSIGMSVQDGTHVDVGRLVAGLRESVEEFHATQQHLTEIVAALREEQQRGHESLTKFLTEVLMISRVTAHHAGAELLRTAQANARDALDGARRVRHGNGDHSTGNVG